MWLFLFRTLKSHARFVLPQPMLLSLIFFSHFHTFAFPNVITPLHLSYVTLIFPPVYGTVVYVNMSPSGAINLLLFVYNCHHAFRLYPIIIYIPRSYSSSNYPIFALYLGPSFPLDSFTTQYFTDFDGLSHYSPNLTRMPGHDHSLQIMFQPDSLSNSAMVLTWICPVGDGEADIFNTLNE